MRAFVTNKRKAANDGYYRRYVTGVRSDVRARASGHEALRPSRE